MTSYAVRISGLVMIAGLLYLGVQLVAVYGLVGLLGMALSLCIAFVVLLGWSRYRN